MVPNKMGDTLPQPHGLTVMIRALKAGLPVGLCTDLDHHQCAYVRDVESLLSEEQQGRFFLSTKKDWTAVVTTAFQYLRK